MENANTVEAPVVEEGAILPSDEAVVNPWDVSGRLDENGLVGGKYKDLDGLIKSADDAQAYISELTSNNKKLENQLGEGAKNAEKEASQIAAIQEMLPQYIDNGNTLTDDMVTRLTEQGMDERDVRLYSMEMKEKIATAHGVVGGAEEYTNMMSWAVDGLSDDDKSSFDKDIMNKNMSALAIEGLHARYTKANGRQAPQSRLSGSNNVNTNVAGYTSRAELMRDKQAAGRGDSGAMDRHRAKLNMTSNEVIYGR